MPTLALERIFNLNYFAFLSITTRLYATIKQTVLKNVAFYTTVLDMLAGMTKRILNVSVLVKVC